jgi:hypothetical protein
MSSRTCVVSFTTPGVWRSLPRQPARNDSVILEIFSQPQAKLRGEVPDVYTYDKIADLSGCR